LLPFNRALGSGSGKNKQSLSDVKSVEEFFSLSIKKLFAVFRESAEKIGISRAAISEDKSYGREKKIH